MILDSGKVVTIKVLERLITIFKLREFSEVVGFFKKYIQGFKQIIKPLNDMILIKFDNC